MSRVEHKPSGFFFICIASLLAKACCTFDGRKVSRYFRDTCSLALASLTDIDALLLENGDENFPFADFLFF